MSSIVGIKKLVFNGYNVKGSIVGVEMSCAIFFLTNKTRNEKGLVLDLIRPNFKMSWTCFQFQLFEK
jgi:hypothetical protein